MHNPCFECLNRYGKQYTEECDNTCEYAHVLSKLKPNGWISVESDEKPKHLQDCLCICRLDDEDTNAWDFYMVLKWHIFPEDNGYVNRPHFTDEGVEGMRVVYWRPLPEHPEKKKKENKK